ncbi:uncharacterized membrane protein YgdD (TMEM256/DUF423 family) [Dysgonomonas alginatilytica]|uniref:Uncharacterized membrane protein YgdD (TMEM256/DUF423 family) n=1 Tax=Dysgonomonas alginatilytica TaxID=1605892 RepID=A0A2V3PPG3_9BACT|nr:DUF423 domain-containing protein [Dysgonomonas alginatilytica]PXV58376.1 uncharacterized membrane protein YgdD (TMEM256/DUF423 family) [Dysgonomonas alginatilytica]
MKQFTLIIAGFYGLITIILGALGSHAFKKILSVDKLASFEVGIRYQMYHAIVLLILGLFLSFTTPLERWSSLCLIIGTFLFSFTIYFLAFSEYWNINLKFLGPVTPIGGVFLIIGWVLLITYFVKSKF